MAPATGFITRAVRRLGRSGPARFVDVKRIPAKNNMSGKPKCILDGCNTKQVSRGLCGTHLKLARALIKSGQKTEEQLIAAGRMMPKQEPVGRPPSEASRLLTECP